MKGNNFRPRAVTDRLTALSPRCDGTSLGEGKLYADRYCSPFMQIAEARSELFAGAIKDRERMTSYTSPTQDFGPFRFEFRRRWGRRRIGDIARPELTTPD